MTQAAKAAGATAVAVAAVAVAVAAVAVAVAAAAVARAAAAVAKAAEVVAKAVVASIGSAAAVKTLVVVHGGLFIRCGLKSCCSC